MQVWAAVQYVDIQGAAFLVQAFGLIVHLDLLEIWLLAIA